MKAEAGVLDENNIERFNDEFCKLCQKYGVQMYIDDDYDKGCAPGYQIPVVVFEDKQNNIVKYDCDGDKCDEKD